MTANQVRSRLAESVLKQGLVLLVLALAPMAMAAPVKAVNFVNDVVPIFTKAGCNSGECHGKAGMGQNGFRLSLLGFEPLED